MTRHLALLAATISLTAAAPALAAPPSWTVVQGQSRIGFSGTHAGNPFNGNFGQWAAAIRFDPKDLAHSRANVVIATGSARTGDKFQETTLAGDEWFAPAKFPRATFTTTAIRATGPDRYVADGTLTIKDKKVPIQLPFTLKMTGDKAVMTGQMTLDRLALDLGAKSDPKAAWVSRNIALTLTVTANRGK